MPLIYFGLLFLSPVTLNNIPEVLLDHLNGASDMNMAAFLLFHLHNHLQGDMKITTVPLRMNSNFLSVYNVRYLHDLQFMFSYKCYNSVVSVFSF